MKHAITVFAVTLVALVWLTPVVTRVLDILWPVFALAIALLSLAGALGGSIWVLGKSLHTLRPDTAPAAPSGPVEMFPPRSLMAFAHTVQSVSSVIPAPAQPAQADTPRKTWDAMTLRFAGMASRCNFNSRVLLKVHVTRTGYNVYIRILKDGQVIRGAQGGNEWSPGWDLDRLMADIAILALPYPNGAPPPVWWHKPDRSHTPDTANTVDTADTPGGVVMSPLGITARG